MDTPTYAFFERRHPSANVVLLRGPNPVLVDTGFGSDVPALIAWLEPLGLEPARLSLIVNTHHHSDHVGGNHALQRQAGIPIAAHAIEAAWVNRRDSRACAAQWLRQRVESYRVDHVLQDGDVIDTGVAVWRVLHTPGHTAGHISLYEPSSGVLIAGDTVHGDDVAWLNPSLDGESVLEQMSETVERLASLRTSAILSGHGPAVDEPARAFEAARSRLERWRRDPEAMVWHAAKRIFAHALILEDGMTKEAIPEYVATSPWAETFAAAVGQSSTEFADALVSALLRGRGAEWRGDRFVATVPHTPLPPGWLRSAASPATWEPV